MHVFSGAEAPVTGKMAVERMAPPPSATELMPGNLTGMLPGC